MANSLHQSRRYTNMNRPASERDFPVKSHLNGRTAIFPYGNRRYHHVKMRVPARGSFQARTCSLAKCEIPKNQKTDRRRTRTPAPPDPARTLGPVSAQMPRPAYGARYRAENSTSPPKGHIHFLLNQLNNNKAGWPNGKALDYESRDCRFDPCVGQLAE